MCDDTTILWWTSAQPEPDRLQKLCRPLHEIAYNFKRPYSAIGYRGHVHTAGVPGRNELDENQELYYPAICRAIAKTDYDSYVGQEFTPKGDPVFALEQAYKACDV